MFWSIVGVVVFVFFLASVLLFLIELGHGRGGPKG